MLGVFNILGDEMIFTLIHRTPEELLDFAKALQPTPSRMEVDAEPLGVNLFLRVWK